jgi:hypothetical protein
MLIILTVKTLHWSSVSLNLYENSTMAEAEPAPSRMILPPDGRQTRIDFFDENASKKHAPDWWQTLSSIFRQHQKGVGVDLDLYVRQLEKEGYSEKSRRSYLFMVKRFFEHFEEIDPCQISLGAIEDYNFEFFVSGRYSRSYQLQFINALQLYYQLIEGIDLNLKQLRRSGMPRSQG